MNVTRCMSQIKLLCDERGVFPGKAGRVVFTCFSLPSAPVCDNVSGQSRIYRTHPLYAGRAEDYRVLSHGMHPSIVVWMLRGGGEHCYMGAIGYYDVILRRGRHYAKHA